MPSECAALGCSVRLTKEFSFHAFPLKRSFLSMLYYFLLFFKWSQKTTAANGNESMGPSHKEVGTKTPRCALLKALKKIKKCFTDRTLLSIHLGSITCPPAWKDFQFESPRMKLRRHCQLLGFCLFPLVIPSFLSLVRCVAFQSFLLCLL